MKELFVMIIVVISISCATVPGRKIVYVEKTPKQNLIDVGKVLLGAAVIIGGYSVIMKKFGKEMAEAIENKPPPPIPVVTITW